MHKKTDIIHPIRKRIYHLASVLAVYALLFSLTGLDAGNGRWNDTGCRTFCCGCWCGGVPGNGDNMIFGCQAGAGDSTITLCGNIQVDDMRFEPCTPLNIVFTGGGANRLLHSDASKSGWICGGSATFTNGARFQESCNFYIGNCSGNSGTLIIDGANSYVDARKIFRVGDCGTGYFELKNGSQATLGCTLDVGFQNCGYGTVKTVSGTILDADGLDMGTGNDSTASVCSAGTFNAIGGANIKIANGARSVATLNLTGTSHLSAPGGTCNILIAAGNCSVACISICSAGSSTVSVGGKWCIACGSGSTATVDLGANVWAQGDKIDIGKGSCSTGCVNIAGTVNFNCNGLWSISTGNGSKSTITMSGGGTVCSGSIAVSDHNNGAATLNLCGVTWTTQGTEFKIGKHGSGYGSFNNITMNTGVDFEVGSNSNAACGAGTGVLYSSNSTYNIAQDMLLGQNSNGHATVVFSGDCITACGGFNMAGGNSGGTDQSSHVTFQNCTSVVVQGAGAGRKSYIGDPGTDDPAQLHIDSGSTFTYNDTRADLDTGTQTIIEIDGGTFTTDCPGCVNLLLEGTAGTGAVIRGNGGTLNFSVELNGGSWGDGDATTETLTIQQNILVGTESTMYIDGGEIALGANNIIDDNIDVTLRGGNLSTGTGAGYNETVQNVTLSQNSTIDLGTGSHTFNMDDLALGGNTLSITGWTGTAGSAGTAGKLYILKSSMTLNGGSSGTDLSGINFSGYTNNYDLIDAGLYWEIVPTNAVPEPSTWFTGTALLSFALWRHRRRKEI